MPKISVIVPVYNTEKFLPKCLDSLVSQTYDDLEIILVDDCSSDNSLDILMSYQEKYPNKVKVISNKNNSGAATSRNNGLSIATGEYIGFVDSDDYVSRKMYEELLEACEETNSHLARTNRRRLLCGIDISFLGATSPKDEDLIINPREHKSFLVTEAPGVTNKLFARDLIGDAKFPDGLKWEDYPFVVPLMLQANQIVNVPERHYVYNLNLNNTTLTDARKLNSRILDIFTCSDMVGASCLTPDVNDNVRRQIEFVKMQHCLVRLKEVAGADIPLQEKRELLTLLSELIKTKYGSWQDHEMYQEHKKASPIHRTRMSIVERLLLPSDSFPKGEEPLKQMIKIKLDKNIK